MLTVLASVGGRRISPPAPRVVPAENDAVSDGGTTMSLDMTLLDLVDAVADHARSDAEVIATVVYMVNSGAVRLCGNFKGARFPLGTLESGTA
jgi:hypothetical protein